MIEGLYWAGLEGETIKVPPIRDICASLIKRYEDQSAENVRLEKANKELHDEHYKDKEIIRLNDEIKELKERLRYGFDITKEEHEKIHAWMDDWFTRKRNGNKYMGACGGGFVYKFHPTGIGTSGVVIAPDGEEFQFQELG